MKKLLPLLYFATLIGCSGPPDIPREELAEPGEVSGGLEILSLTKDQARAIREWEANQADPLAKPEEYFKFIESQLRFDQKGAFRSIAKGDLEKIAAYSIEVLNAASERFLTDCGKFPSKAEDLSKDPGLEGWNGPYSKNIVDPWGLPYQFEIVDDKLEIRSLGPDRIEGAGDITNE